MPILTDAQKTSYDSLVTDYPIRTVAGISDVNDVIASDGQRLAWDDVLLKWTPKTSTSGLGILQLTYRMSLPVDTTPTAGHISRDTNSGVLGTPLTLYFSKLDNTGTDLSLFFNEMQAGQWLNIHEEDDTANAERYDIVGVAVLNGDIFEVPVTVYDLLGTALSNNTKLKAFWRTISPDNRLPQGGTTGQVLTKLSDVDYDTEWTIPAANALQELKDRTIILEHNDRRLEIYTGSDLGNKLTFHEISTVLLNNGVDINNVDRSVTFLILDVATGKSFSVNYDYDRTEFYYVKLTKAN